MRALQISLRSRPQLVLVAVIERGMTYVWDINNFRLFHLASSTYSADIGDD